MKAPEFLVLLLCLAPPAGAQDLTRNIEMPGHRSLMQARAQAPLAPFETDGCSGGLSSGWRLVADTFPEFRALYETTPPWESCCVTHDRAYHDAGGAAQPADSYDARLSADITLRDCVKSQGAEQADAYTKRFDMSSEQVRSAYSTIAEAMFLAVRFGGGPCTGLPWRWGYGYEDCKPFNNSETARD